MSGHPSGESIAGGRRTRGTETSKYPQEKKVKTIFLVVASEREGAQTGWHVKACMRCAAGVAGSERDLSAVRPGSYKFVS
jgi:hypothetical protein